MLGVTVRFLEGTLNRFAEGDFVESRAKYFCCVQSAPVSILAVTPEHIREYCFERMSSQVHILRLHSSVTEP